MLYIHIGLPKTATTSLQYAFKKNINGIHYEGVVQASMFESSYGDGYREGKVKGEARGEAKATRKMVLNMLKKQIGIEEIAEITRLTATEIQETEEDADNN